MIDFHNAGGMLALLHTLRPLLYLKAKTITGHTLGEVLDSSVFHTFSFSAEIIRPLSDPLFPSSSLVVVRGNMTPNGAVLKASASKNKQLLSHSGPAVVFRNESDLANRIDDPNLEVTADSVLILQNIGPKGYPGMPEAGLIPIPRKLATQGVTDMLRLSDGRMSGTASGTIILQISPESADPQSVFGIVQTGDIITFDLEKRQLKLRISDDIIQARLASKQATHNETKHDGSGIDVVKRGYKALYERCVNQAEDGTDF
jgi:dihydroxy-acid dehydratase